MLALIAHFPTPVELGRNFASRGRSIQDLMALLHCQYGRGLTLPDFQAQLCCCLPACEAVAGYCDEMKRGLSRRVK